MQTFKLNSIDFAALAEDVIDRVVEDSIERVGVQSDYFDDLIEIRDLLYLDTNEFHEKLMDAVYGSAISDYYLLSLLEEGEGIWEPVKPFYDNGNEQYLWAFFDMMATAIWWKLQEYGDLEEQRDQAIQEDNEKWAAEQEHQAMMNAWLDK